MSTHSNGFTSSGSSISLGGLTAGVKSSRRLPDFSTLPLNKTSYVLSGLYFDQPCDHDTHKNKLT